MNYSNHITINTNIRFGKPCIKGTRISVFDIKEWIDSGMSVSEIINDFPELNEEQIKVCLTFIADKVSKKHTDRDEL